MAYDPPELTGNGQKADPTAGASVRVVPVGTTRPDTHPKHAIVAPRKAWEAAMIETAEARVELIDATAAHRTAETAEGAAVAAWMSLNRPDRDQLIRDHINRQAEIRLANKLAGRDPNYSGPVDGIDASPISQAAKARGRHAGGTAQQAGVPLRSNVAQRRV